MAALEQVMQLKEQGYSEQDIVNYLKDQGIDQKEIYDALAQSNIKSELNRESAYNQGMFPTTPGNQIGDGDYPAGSQPIPQQEYSMQPSMMTPKESPQQMQPMPAEYQEQYPNYQDSQQGYQQNYYPEYQSSDVETITEIAEQLIEEKNEKIQKQISTLLAFKEETSAEIERINQRLEKIESNFNNLQTSIIRKIGEYGEDIKNIGKEMHANQESFSKLINPIIDNARGIQEEGEEVTETSKPRKTKKSADFEDYLR